MVLAAPEEQTDYLGFLDSDTGEAQFPQKGLGYQLKIVSEGNKTLA